MDLSNLPFIMIRCLLLTIIIELVVGFILGIRDKKDIINIMLVNVITNPIVVITPIIVYLRFGYKFEIITLIILEILTVIVEGLIYRKTLRYNKMNLILFSLILNACSYFIGEIINLF